MVTVGRFDWRTDPIPPGARLRYGLARGVGPEEAELQLRAVMQMRDAAHLVGWVDDAGAVDEGRLFRAVDQLTGASPPPGGPVHPDEARRVHAAHLVDVFAHAGNVVMLPTVWWRTPLGRLCRRVLGR